MNTDSSSVGLTETKTFTLPEPFRTESGSELPGVEVAYETYGELNAAGDNAVLVIHALTGDAHAAGYHSPGDPRPGNGGNLTIDTGATSSFPRTTWAAARARPGPRRRTPPPAAPTG